VKREKQTGACADRARGAKIAKTCNRLQPDEITPASCLKNSRFRFGPEATLPRGKGVPLGPIEVGNAASRVFLQRQWAMSRPSSYESRVGSASTAWLDGSDPFWPSDARTRRRGPISSIGVGKGEKSGRFGIVVITLRVMSRGHAVLR
jgi:hypothetical protein